MDVMKMVTLGVQYDASLGAAALRTGAKSQCSSWPVENRRIEGK